MRREAERGREQDGAAAGRRALLLGVLSSLFFSITYVVNDSMALSGGSWMWSACLRFFFMLPVLFAIVLAQKGLGRVWAEICRRPLAWLGWSTLGFGAFYALLTFSAAYGPSWLVAGTFQFTILAGALMTPLFYTEGPGGRRRGKIPFKLLPAFVVILVGVFLLQVENATAFDLSHAVVFALPVMLSAFCYPLGNRKTMELCADRLTTIQRVFAMTLCSLPFWLAVAVAAGLTAGAPSPGQLAQTAVVAVFSGLFATLIFFYATQLVRQRAQWLAMVESTQCGEVVFSLAGGILLLGNPLPGLMGFVGLALVVAGMVWNALLQKN